MARVQAGCINSFNLTFVELNALGDDSMPPRRELHPTVLEAALQLRGIAALLASCSDPNRRRCVVLPPQLRGGNRLKPVRSCAWWSQGTIFLSHGTADKLLLRCVLRWWRMML